MGEGLATEFKEKLLELLNAQNVETDHEKKLALSERIAALAEEYDYYLADDVSLMEIDEQERLVLRVKILKIPRDSEGNAMSYAPGVDDNGDQVKTRI